MSENTPSPAAETPKKKKRLTREEQANIEVGTTEISRGTAKLLVFAFLAFVILIPTVQHIRELASGEPLGFLSLFADAPDAFKEGYGAKDLAGAGFVKRFNSGNKQLLKVFKDYETELEEDSYLSGLIPPMQALNTRTLLKGNELAVLGIEGWAFFKPGVDYLTGTPFLDAAQLRSRSLGAPEWEQPPEPDPRPALLELNAFLKAQGVQLYVVPAPVKPMIHPEQLSPRYADNDAPLQNPSFTPLVAELEAAGIKVIDLAPTLFEHKPSYLRTDTHWNSEGMQRAADEIARSVMATSDIKTGSLPLENNREVVINEGDITATTLELKGTDIFGAEETTIQQFTSDDQPLNFSDPAAEIVLLGDSFANIFSVNEDLNWGENAGLREHLAARFRQPVLAITMNDNGAFASREALFDLCARQGTGFFKNKKVVIYEFAARELAVGDWKTFDWSRIPQTTATTTAAAPLPPTDITGTIELVSRPPRPGTVAYKNCIVQLYLTGVEGLPEGDSALIRMYGMRDNKWTSAAEYKLGQQVRLRCEDWYEAAKTKKLATMKVETVALPDEIAFGDPPPELWAEEALETDAAPEPQP